MQEESKGLRESFIYFGYHPFQRWDFELEPDQSHLKKKKKKKKRNIEAKER
jgi:hypothetical protein